MLLIIDNQSQFLRKWKRDYLDEHEIPHTIVSHNEQLSSSVLDRATGLMLSGGKGNPYEPLNLTANYVAMMNLDVPTIGLCLGHEIIAVAHRCRINRLEDYQSKKDEIVIDDASDPIFDGVGGPRVVIQKKHRFHVPTSSKALRIIAHSAVCPIEVFRHVDRPIYGFQGHPEVSGKPGLRIMRNFLAMCELAPD